LLALFASRPLPTGERRMVPSRRFRPLRDRRQRPRAVPFVL